MEVKDFKLPEGVNFSDDEKKGLQALGDYIKSQMQEMAAGITPQEQIIEAAKAEFEKLGITGAKLEKLEAALKTQGTELAAMKMNGGQKQNQAAIQIKAFIENMENIERVKAHGTASLVLKAEAAAMLTPAASVPISMFNTEVVPGIQEAPRESNAIYPRLLKGSTSSPLIKWVNRVNGNGGAAFIAEGMLKPLKDWTYDEGESTAKKIAVRCKVSTEMLSDFAYMRAEINRLLREDLMERVDEKLLTGSTAVEPKGILNNAAGYTTTSLDGTISSPNYADAIRASVLQLRLLNYTPNILFINPADKAAIDLTKDNNGRYMADELQKVIGNITTVETTRIDAGKFLLMDTSRWFVRNLEEFRLEYGWENDDFTKNMVSVIAEMRLHSYQNDIDAGSLVYGTFATIQAALAKAA